jgi:carbon monoxide dehydrogenase subunit G
VKVTGTATLKATPQQVWEAFHDPDVLTRTLPGCESLEAVGEDRYRLTLSAGVAAIRGRYDGEVALSDQQHPDSFVLHAWGAGVPGTVSTDVRVQLVPAGEGTELTYDADAVVGGPIGGVGQRMLTGVSKKMAGAFFAAVDADIAGVRKEVPAGARPIEGVGTSVPPFVGTLPPGRAGAEAVAAGRLSAGATYAGGGGAPVAPGREFALGVAVGGIVALAGVVLGALIGRRRR